MITIKHDHENGTLVHGTSKGDGVYELIGPRTAARFKYFRSIEMIGIPQSRDHLAKRYQIDTAAEILRNAGHDVTVEIDDTPRDVTDVKSDRASRLDQRYDRLTAKAERNAAEATARFDRASQIAERFAGGQPILVGHHSERGARADQKRIDQAMRAGTQLANKADRASYAASRVGIEDARRERPDVIIRRIAKNEAELRQTMHRINGTRPANDWRGAYYAPERKPATGAWLEQCEARRVFLEHRLEADRAALEAAKAAGYVQLDRTSVHVGDVIRYWRSQGGEVVRVNAKTVSIKTEYSWTDKVSYEEIRSVMCPHDNPEVAAAIAKHKAETDSPVKVIAPPAARPEPRPAPVKVERPEHKPEPLRVDARTECFVTPPAIVARMIEAADIEAGMTVLEPSAGTGAIAGPVARLGAVVDCIEQDPRLAGYLRGNGIGCDVREADFLTVEPNPILQYDRVMMNPPFAREADIAHVTHALGFLRPGGLLVAIMSAHADFGTDKTAEAFRKLVADRGGSLSRLPADAFRSSGTSVSTVMAVIPGGVAEPGPLAVCLTCEQPIYEGDRTDNYAGQSHYACAHASEPEPEPERAGTLF